MLIMNRADGIMRIGSDPGNGLFWGVYYYSFCVVSRPLLFG